MKGDNMFSKILIATDLSDASNKVICTLGGLKSLGTKEALLVHCFNIRDIGTLADQLMELSKPSFEKQKKMLEEQGFKTTGKMVLGLPHIEINRIADDSDCSIIVVGSHGHTMAGEIALGGVASSIIHSATKPVLLLRLRLKDEKGAKICESPVCDPLNHILFPTDFSDNAEHAFSYVQKIADCGAKKVTLLHVQDQSKIDRHLKERLEEFNQIDTERLGRLRTDLEKRGVKDIRIEIPYGLPKKEIFALANEDDVSLVVMGSQGRGYISEMFLGSVSHAVARHSEVPVLLIPAIR
jgi:nucleotide-binding universal stress UspA family protein